MFSKVLDISIYKNVYFEIFHSQARHPETVSQVCRPRYETVAMLVWGGACPKEPRDNPGLHSIGNLVSQIRVPISVVEDNEE